MAAADKSTVLIYGAYGYTGKLCCEEAQKQALSIVIGGVSFCLVPLGAQKKMSYFCSATLTKLGKLPQLSTGPILCVMPRALKRLCVHPCLVMGWLLY
jgi:hypothetical protein